MSFQPGDRVRFHRLGNQFDRTEGIVGSMTGEYVNMTDTEGRAWSGTHFSEFTLIEAAPGLLDLSDGAQEYEEAMAGSELLKSSAPG